MQLKELQKFQHDHDLRFHSDVMSWDKGKQLEHSTFHLAKLAGLFSTYCEKTHHGESVDASRLFEERIPDILVFALKLSNLMQLDLETSYLARIRAVESRVKR